MRRITFGRSVAGAVLALSLAASVPVAAQSPSAAPATAPSSPAASAATGGAPTTRVLVPSGGFIVSLPTDWLVLDFEADPEAAMDAFLVVHPELEDHIRAFLATGPMAMMAIAPAADGDPFPATFTSFRGANMGMSAASMLDFTLSGLTQVPGVRGNIGGELRTIGGQPGLAAGYDWELPLGDGAPAPVRVEQFTVVTPAEVWAFSVTDDATAPDAWRAIADSFELLP